jgi:hypothetical protein
MASRDETVREIALHIESYLSRHQEGADSPEGIRSFWLPAHLRSEPLEWVVAALERLQARGLVVKTDIEPSGSIYSRANRARVH